MPLCFFIVIIKHCKALGTKYINKQKTLPKTAAEY